MLVLERTGSPAWAAAVTAVSLAGYVGIGQVLATLADRFGRISVMLVADVARAALFLAMLLDVPVGVLLVLAFLAGLATPPFEAARSAALPDLVPEEGYRRRARAVRASPCSRPWCSATRSAGLLLTVVDPETALAINALQLPRVRRPAPRAPAQPGRATRPAYRATVSRSLGDGAASLFGDRMVRRALVFVSVTGAFGTVDEALVVPVRRSTSVCPTGSSVCWPRLDPGRHPARRRASIAGGRRDHHSLLRTAGWCGVDHRRRWRPRCSGSRPAAAWPSSRSRSPAGMFAVSIPTNTVIGLRLSRDTRASAMGIAVGVLMGCQALGAALGGIAASVVGSPARHRRGAAPRRRLQPLVRGHDPDARPSTSRSRPRSAVAPARADTVVDLVAMEAEQPAAGSP